MKVEVKPGVYVDLGVVPADQVRLFVVHPAGQYAATDLPQNLLNVDDDALYMFGIQCLAMYRNISEKAKGGNDGYL